MRFAPSCGEARADLVSVATSLLLAAADAVDFAMDLAAYAQKWDGIYGTEDAELQKSRAEREWHSTWARLAPLADAPLRSLSERVPPQNVRCMDIGCGTSTLGIDLCAAHNFGHLLLLDASAVCIARHEAAAAGRTAPPAITALVGDARVLPVPDGSYDVLIEKGTLDALDSAEDQRAMLADCRRALAPSGLLLSIAFQNVRRLALLDAALPPLGLTHHTHIVTSVDAPNAVVFVSLIFHSASAHVPPYAPDERTKTMLARVAASGSLWEDAADFEVPDPFDS